MESLTADGLEPKGLEESMVGVQSIVAKILAAAPRALVIAIIKAKTAATERNGEHTDSLWSDHCQ